MHTKNPETCGWSTRICGMPFCTVTYTPCKCVAVDHCANPDDTLPWANNAEKEEDCNSGNLL